MQSRHRRAMQAVLQSRTSDLRSVVSEARAALGLQPAALMAASVFADAVTGLVVRCERPTLEQLMPMADFRAAFDFNPAFVPDRAWPRFVMLVTLADFAAGKFPDRVENPNLGFMYERGERLAWVFGGAQYQRDEVQHQRGFYAGVSMQVVPGLYSRVGSYQPGATVEGMVPIAEGNLVVTDRALWFQGPHGIQRTLLADITYLQCVKNGFVFCTRGSRNEMYLTGVDEGWFSHALVTEIRNSAT